MKKTFEVIKTVLTWLIVLLAVCMMVFTIVSVTTFERNDRALFGYKMYIVRSDSMSATDFTKAFRSNLSGRTCQVPEKDQPHRRRGSDPTESDRAGNTHRQQTGRKREVCFSVEGMQHRLIDGAARHQRDQRGGQIDRNRRTLGARHDLSISGDG